MPLINAMCGRYRWNLGTGSSAEARYSSPSITATRLLSLNRTMQSKPSNCAPTR